MGMHESSLTAGSCSIDIHKIQSSVVNPAIICNSFRDESLLLQVPSATQQYHQPGGYGRNDLNTQGHTVARDEPWPIAGRINLRRDEAGTVSEGKEQRNGHGALVLRYDIVADPCNDHAIVRIDPSYAEIHREVPYTRFGAANCQGVSDNTDYG